MSGDKRLPIVLLRAPFPGNRHPEVTILTQALPDNNKIAHRIHGYMGPALVTGPVTSRCFGPLNRIPFRPGEFTPGGLTKPSVFACLVPNRPKPRKVAITVE